LHQGFFPNVSNAASTLRNVGSFVHSPPKNDEKKLALSGTSLYENNETKKFLGLLPAKAANF